MLITDISEILIAEKFIILSFSYYTYDRVKVWKTYKLNANYISLKQNFVTFFVKTF